MIIISQLFVKAKHREHPIKNTLGLTLSTAGKMSKVYSSAGSYSH